MTDQVITQREGDVLHARLNRPEKKNAINDAMYGELVKAYQQAEEDKSIKALILSGEGDSFTSGNDLSVFASYLSMAPDTDKEPAAYHLIKAGLSGTVPVIAAIEGWCVGIGATMMLHTDFIYAARDAVFHMPFTQLGAVPEGVASTLLTRRFGRQRAARMLIASEKISAETALSWGMITELVDPGTALDAARACAERLAQLPPGAVRDTKALMQEDLETAIPHAREELLQFAKRLKSEEMQQVIATRMAGKN
ncbi:MAG: enoyl-CoA hydratase-related protein [Pseudomonadota bacterium]